MTSSIARAETEMLIAEHLHGVNAFVLRNFGVNLSTFVLGDDGEGMLGSIGIATRGGSDAAAAAAAAASATAAAAAAAADPLNAISDYFTLGKSKFCQVGEECTPVHLPERAPTRPFSNPALAPNLLQAALFRVWMFECCFAC